MRVVVDTNVILTANNAHPEASPECVIACVERLNDLMKFGVLVLDDSYQILQEYQKKTSPRKAKGVGDHFVDWALRHQKQPNRVELVTLTKLEMHRYAEFPDPALEPFFDPPDRMFPAVSNTHPAHPPIWQATDCKWLDWWPALDACGVKVEFLCETDICRFYNKKFPAKPIPLLP
jgi:predicted nucleic acid-binding protein